MILSASRRTDLPALYGEWLLNRLREGFVIVPNPYHAGRATKVVFTPETVDCIVFWTKNPIPFQRFLPEIEVLGYRDFCFQYTITAFGRELEPGLPEREERIGAFLRLSQRLGPERVDWRFDPIIVDGTRSPQWHAERFEQLCRRLAGHTGRCILSFVDRYSHLGREFQEMGREEMERTAELLSQIAAVHRLPLYTCAEEADLSAYGIRHASCIDREKLEKLLGCALKVKKDPGQRSACGCVESVEIGSYNTCVNGCAYCYATRSRPAALRSFQAHDPLSPMLAGWPAEALDIHEKSPPSLKTGQTSLF